MTDAFRVAGLLDLGTKHLVVRYHGRVHVEDVEAVVPEAREGLVDFANHPGGPFQETPRGGPR